jgi:hypothetical protein
LSVSGAGGSAIDAAYGILAAPEGPTAVLEAAQVVGITDAAGMGTPVGMRTTRGVGELIRALHAEHGDALFGHALRLCNGDRQRAEDLVQETLLRAWRHAAQGLQHLAERLPHDRRLAASTRHHRCLTSTIR